MKLIAIDPGKNGGVAILREDKTIRIHKIPITPKDTEILFKMYQKDAVCFIEKVFGMPGRGGSAMFTFGQMYGWLEMALINSKIPTTQITPQKWIKFHGLGTKGSMTDTEWKNKLKARAQQLHPNVAVTLWNADALLILEYAKANNNQ
jgi:hypothetical protein